MSDELDGILKKASESKTEISVKSAMDDVVKLLEEKLEFVRADDDYIVFFSKNTSEHGGTIIVTGKSSLMAMAKFIRIMMKEHPGLASILLQMELGL